MARLLGARRTFSRRMDGVELVRATVSCDSAAGALADVWIENALRWTDDVLVPYAKQVFEKDPASDKRFTFRRFEYVLSVSLSSASAEEAELRVKATLARARGAVIVETHHVERLRLADRAFLPSESKKKAPRRVRRSVFSRENR